MSKFEWVISRYLEGAMGSLLEGSQARQSTHRSLVTFDCPHNDIEPLGTGSNLLSLVGLLHQTPAIRRAAAGVLDH